MTDKPIWAGKYADIDATVVVHAGSARPYLAGQYAYHHDDTYGILDVAVRELAAERDSIRAKLETVVAELRDLREKAGTIAEKHADSGAGKLESYFLGRADALRVALNAIENAMKGSE